MNISENKDIKIGLVIMASGLGKRFGGNKLVEDLNGKPLIRWIIDSSENLFDRRVVVTRSNDVKNICDGLNLRCILHSFPDRNDTVRLGLCELMQDVDYCFFVPGDQPLIGRNSIMNLLEEAKANKNLIVRTGYADSVGAPIGFPNSFFDDLLKLPKGKGGNYIAQNNQNIVRIIEVHDEYELWDIDTTEDLTKINSVLKEYFD
ncbi:MAG: nucleotidyltransferase family protein [Lachnospiraceae bacterium]|nr:nucleotidyltransferase family protein [Lachnospiraceae bacterium]